MEFKMMARLAVLVAVLGLLSACERPLYFAGGETNLLTRLEKAGDVQLQVAIVNIDEQQSYQGVAEVAVTNRLALRAGWLQGGDDFEPIDRQYGRLSAYHVGLGSFYPIGNTGIMAATWLGFSRGEVRNRSLLFGYEPKGEPEYLLLTNDYSRFYLEQQARFTYKEVDFFALVRAGRSHVFHFNQSEVPGDPSRLSRQLNWQLSNPNVFFATVGYGLAGGTKNLRVHLQLEHWLGDGRQQLTDDFILAISTGVSWRFGTAALFK